MKKNLRYEYLTYYKNLLGLSDWNIVCKIKHAEDMELDSVQGEVKYSMVGKYAVISILDCDDWDNDDFSQDEEKTLVHELLHLRFDLIEVGKNMDTLYHQLLDDVSKAIVNARRTGSNPLFDKDMIMFHDEKE